DSPLSVNLETRSGDFEVRHGTFAGGVSEGVEIVRMQNSLITVDVLPTRGMSLWQLSASGKRFGWQSPVVGPVHPDRVNRWDPSGLGWLDGFDELVVRCGLESNGAPVHDAAGRLQFPLHGHIGNLPADSLRIEYDQASGRLELIGEMIEARLFFKRLRLRSRIRLHADRPSVELLDDVTNELSTPAVTQMLYHINVGAPLLGEGAKVHVPLDEIAPRDAHAAEEIERWDVYDRPTSGYSERVYFGKPRADDSGFCSAMLTDANAENALGVRFKVSTLPYFILWKNTAEISDGYVTGLEPASNFPNGRDKEVASDRCVRLDGGQSVSYRLELNPMTDATAVAKYRADIDALVTSGGATTLHADPVPSWSHIDG
ncbi:MAG: aldose 1-epimerase family protein, partial [Planctomycetota bacterium]